MPHPARSIVPTSILSEVLKALLPPVAISVGILNPQLSRYNDAIAPLLMLLLFASFTRIDVREIRRHVSLNVLLVPLANVLLALAWYAAIAPFDLTLARLYFITAIAPTAAAAPATIALLNRNVAYTTVATLIANSGVALCVPLFSLWLFEGDGVADPRPMLQSVAVLMGVPLLLSQLWQQLPRRWRSRVNWQPVTLVIWGVLLSLASAKASDFIYNSSELSLTAMAAIALHAAIICAVNFLIGWWLGGKRFSREASQSLGHKNTMFAIWFVLSFLNPTFALGPMFYIVFQNLYNAYQIATVRPQP